MKQTQGFVTLTYFLSSVMLHYHKTTRQETTECVIYFSYLTEFDLERSKKEVIYYFISYACVTTST